MQVLKRRRNTFFIIAARSATVTFFMLGCLFAAIIFMGKAYANIEMTAFGREVVFFDALGNDVYSFFGKEFYFPLVSLSEKTVAFLRMNSPGIIKLLGWVVDAVKESASYLTEILSKYTVS